MKNENRVLIVGTVRNVGKTLKRDIARINSAFPRDFEKSFFFVESDSSDRTIEEIQKLQENYRDVSFVTLGNLQSKIPNRIERIRHCRQQYVQRFRELQQTKKWTYVLVCDLDGINNILRSKHIQSCFNSSIQWSACFPVQTQGYYDLYALRHPVWMPRNLFEEIRQIERTIINRHKRLSNFFASWKAYFEIDKIKRNQFYSRMLKLQGRTEWIQVDSAFGGLGLYKAETFLNHDYSYKNVERGEYSEHLDLHKSMTQDGLKLYINPKFMNSSWNSYNLNRHFIVRLYRRLGLKLNS